jgi:hypothetical protein
MIPSIPKSNGLSFNASGVSSSSNPTATLVLKHLNYGSGRVTINGTTLNYDGTAGTNFPDPITSTDAFSALFRAIGTDATFSGGAAYPTITGGTFTGDIAESESGTLQITWDGVSSEIVITTSAFKD